MRGKIQVVRSNCCYKDPWLLAGVNWDLSGVCTSVILSLVPFLPGHMFLWTLNFYGAVHRPCPDPGGP